MTDSNDRLGDALRRFYNSHGVANEGPPAGVNVSALFSEATVAASDLQILENAVNDSKLLGQFRNCRDVLDDLATRLKSEELLRELVGIPLPTESAFEPGAPSFRVLCERVGLPENGFEKELTVCILWDTMTV